VFGAGDALGADLSATLRSLPREVSVAELPLT